MNSSNIKTIYEDFEKEKKKMLKNTQEITKVKFSKIAHCFCPLGNDWYTCNVDAEVRLEKN